MERALQGKPELLGLLATWFCDLGQLIHLPSPIHSYLKLDSGITLSKLHCHSNANDFMTKPGKKEPRVF